VIDLHTHSTASDGSLAPDALATRLARSGITTFALSDHDTTAGLAAAAAGARAAGLGFLPAIEITAVDGGRDVHVLGYGIDAGSAPLAGFLAEQRGNRRARITEIEAKLAALGMPITLAARESGPGTSEDERSIGRPVVARALVAAGYVASISEAFERFLLPGCPAFVPRTGAPVAEVIAVIARAGGLASLAHPATTKKDASIASWVEAGLPAIEVWHSDHDAEAVARYAEMAARWSLLTTGGSDFHGDEAGRECRIGEVGIPEDAFARLVSRLDERVRLAIGLSAR
jgi:predicted metal-dependent phosphoesterase TrpH